MLNKLVICSLVLTSATSAIHAATIEQLSKKNSELLELKADLAIAKTKDELFKLKQVANPSIASSQGQIVSQQKIKPVKPSPTADIDMVEFIGAGGDYANPTGKFLIGNAAINRRQGELINGWLLTKLTANEANFTKPGKGEILQKSIYLSAVNRLNERRTSQPVMGGTTTSPFVPAVTPQQPPIR